jgi:hypothetical protein
MWLVLRGLVVSLLGGAAAAAALGAGSSATGVVTPSVA